MREKLPFNQSLDRYLIGLLCLSLGVTSGNACYNISKNFKLAYLVLFRGGLCHPLLITFRLLMFLARLLETKVGKILTLARISTKIFYFFRRMAYFHR